MCVHVYFKVIRYNLNASGADGTRKPQQVDSGAGRRQQALYIAHIILWKRAVFPVNEAISLLLINVAIPISRGNYMDVKKVAVFCLVGIAVLGMAAPAVAWFGPFGCGSLFPFGLFGFPVPVPVPVPVPAAIPACGPIGAGFGGPIDGACGIGGPVGAGFGGPIGSPLGIGGPVGARIFGESASGHRQCRRNWRAHWGRLRQLLRSWQPAWIGRRIWQPARAWQLVRHRRLLRRSALGLAALMAARALPAASMALAALMAALSG